MKRKAITLTIIWVIAGFLYSAYAQQNGNKQSNQRTAPTGETSSKLKQAIKGVASADDPVERCTAIIKLIEMGPQAAPAIPYLIALLDDSAQILVLSNGPVAGKKYIRELAAQALIAIGKAATDALIQVAMLEGSDQIHRYHAIELLGKIKDASTGKALISLLSDQKVRNSAASALGNLKDVGAVDPLIKLLMEKETVRNAASALGAIGDPRAVEPLIKALLEARGCN